MPPKSKASASDKTQLAPAGMQALLPPGSELKDVMFPSYDDQHRLTAVLKAKSVILDSAELMTGTAVTIETFNAENGSRSGRIDLAHARLDQAKGVVSTTDPVEIRSTQLIAKGRGLTYSLAQRRGYLIGPATTRLLQPPAETKPQAPPKTSMKSPASSLFQTAAIGAAFASQPLVAVPPPPITLADKAALNAAAQAAFPAAQAAAADARDTLGKAKAEAVTAGQAADTFIAENDLPTPAGAAIPPSDKPLDVKPSLNDTVINCDGGFYFDPDEGVLVYLKNVTVKDPRFDLSGANELKIFMEKKPAKAEGKTEAKSDSKNDPKEESAGLGGGLGGKFGKPSRFVATGDVLLKQKATEDGKEAINASARIVEYKIKSKQMTLQGGFPWFTQGASFARAKQPNLMLRIDTQTNQAVTEGQWEMGLKLPDKK